MRLEILTKKFQKTFRVEFLRDIEQNTTVPKLKDSTKTKGSFFSFAENFHYRPRGIVIGQNTPDSCVAAVCQMILHDENRYVLEYHLRSVLKINRDGTSIAKIPVALKKCGLTKHYQFLSDLDLAQLQSYCRHNLAVVLVKKTGEPFGHALIVDGFETNEVDSFVLIRDSLPESLGAAYKVKIDVFKKFWLWKNDLRGLAVVVKSVLEVVK